MKIAIIGGGFTGLTAAYRLSQKGHQVSIFERGSDLGGLAGGFEIEGTSLEKTYHHIFKTDTDIINLVKELKIEDKLEWRESSISIYYDGCLHSFKGALDLIKFKPLSLDNRLRAGLVVLFLQKTKNWRKFEKVSAYHWMRKWSGEQVTKVIWEPLLKGKFDTFYDKVSMAWLWARLHVRANSRDGLEAEKLGYFNGGFNVITKSLVKKLKEKNVSIFTNNIVEKIERNGNKIKIVQNKDLELIADMEFDRVIATVPSHIFAKLTEEGLPREYLKKLESIPYLGAVCMIFTSDQDLSPYYWHNINDLTSPFLVFINHTKFIPKERYNGQNVYYIGSYIPHDHAYFSMSEKELYALWFDYVKKIFPKFDESHINEKFLFRFKNAQHIVGWDYANKIPEYKTPIEGVYLSNFSQIYPEDRGTNFAVREGNRIAELVLE